MDTNTIGTIEAIEETMAADAAEREIDALDLIDGLAIRRDNLREQLAAAEAEYRELLPMATAAQFAILRTMVRHETALPDGADQLNVHYRIGEEQLAVLKSLRAERRAECIAAKEATMKDILRDEMQKLVSVKVRVGVKKTTSNLRFEKSHTVARSIADRIRAAQAARK